MCLVISTKTDNFTIKFNDFIYSIKSFFIEADKIYGACVDYQYQFKNFYTKQDSKFQDVYFEINSLSLDKDNCLIKERVLSSENYKLGYHISLINLELLNQIKNNTKQQNIYSIVKFKKEDVQLFNGSTVIVSRFGIPDKDEQYTFLNILEKFYLPEFYSSEALVDCLYILEKQTNLLRIIISRKENK